jgi:hypothetical protein
MSFVPSWIAVGFGALDVRGDDSVGGQYEVLVTPAMPGTPLFLFGEGAALWRRLVRGPISEEALSAEERTMILEMAEAGIASTEENHPARMRALREPWLLSPFHELVYALLSKVAAANSVDIIFIKGPTLHAQGLRDREHSGDVDCWVRPGSEVSLAKAMSEWGWSPAFSAFTGTPVLHSLTLRAGQWGSAVDVHSWFPGMAIDPQSAFERVCDMSEQREFAGVVVRTPRRSVHAVISALHDVRPVLGREAGSAQNERAAETIARAGEEVVATSRLLASDYALSEALQLAFPHRPIDVTGAAVPRDWLWRSQSSPRRAYVEALKLIPPHERPKVLLRVIWPTPQSLRAGPLGAGSPGVPIWRLRLRRLKHGVRMLRSAK